MQACPLRGRHQWIHRCVLRDYEGCYCCDCSLDRICTRIGHRNHDAYSVAFNSDSQRYCCRATNILMDVSQDDEINFWFSQSTLVSIESQDQPLCLLHEKTFEPL